MTEQVKEIYAEVYEDLQEDIDDVLREHALKQVEQRLAEANQQVQRWEAKYGCDYDTFIRRAAADPKYVQQLNANVETQMWEGDSISWEFDVLELQRWQNHLQKLLTT
jgi:hypothetical protein